MVIHFSTIDKREALERFEHPNFAWLPQVAKDYVIENLGDLRVQCTVMYPSPQVEFHGPDAKKHHDKVMEIILNSKKQEPKPE